MTIRLLSWNVHGLPYPVTRNRAHRMQRIGERIAAEKADVAVLQEVWPGALTPLVSAAAGYSAHFVPTFFGSPSGGLVVLVRDGAGWSVDAGSLRFRAYSRWGARRKVWEGDGIAGKGALFVALDDASGRRLWIAATHLQSRYGSSDYANVRLWQVRELGRWLGELADPVLVAGDFNTPATEAQGYQAISALGIDLTQDVRHRTGAVTNYPLHSTAAWIDFVLLRPGNARLERSSLRLIENERIDHPYSDHSALVADVDLEVSVARETAPSCDRVP
jgi:endonuclease/exonuclease/phosphatase family metal-dependent hydrolase